MLTLRNVISVFILSSLIDTNLNEDKISDNALRTDCDDKISLEFKARRFLNKIFVIF